MSLSRNIRNIGFRLGVTTTTDVPKQLGVNLVTASAADTSSARVPSLNIERPPLVPALRTASAVPGDATGRISSIPPTSYRPTTIPSLSLAPEQQLKNIGKNSLSFLKSTFFSPEPASTELNT